MAHFRGIISNGEKKSSRIGTKISGLVVECNSWSLGADCIIKYNEKKQRDEISIYLTSGSGKKRDFHFLGKFIKEAETGKFLQISQEIGKEPIKNISFSNEEV